MAVRIKLKLKPRMAFAAPLDEVVALVNSGYEAGRRELIIPAGLAAHLGWWPAPAGASLETYGSPGGGFQIHRLRDALEVAATASGRTGPFVLADAIIATHQDEVLISDALPGPLKIALLDVTEGLWSFRDELTVPRQSEARQIW